MQYLDLTLPGAAANLALDEALLLEAEASGGENTLRVWEWPAPAVVLGANGVLSDEVDEAACGRDNVPILRRSSGGGTVLLGPGCLLFSLVMDHECDPQLAGIGESYRHILGSLCDILGDIAPGIVPAGTSDLAVAGQKVSGNAQQRKHRFLLHHGSLLYAFDVTLIGRYLRTPQRQPEYRGGRNHGDFVTNLQCSAGELRRRLRKIWNAEHERTTWPVELVRKLAAEKYSIASWIRRR